MKQKILEKIREVCDLKRLEFGAKVKVKIEDDWFSPDREYTIARKATMYKDDSWEIVENQQCCIDEDNFEIIGLPVELNHLLLALDKVSKGDWFTLLSSNGWFTARTDRAYYNLQLSVEQNLDNPELCKLVGELLDIKE